MSLHKHILALGCQLSLLSCLQAEVKLPSIFSDHMVLQRSAQVPVWGKADPGEAITVQVAGQTSEAIADDTGKWELRLDLEDVPQGPFSMTVTGTNTLTIEDVVVGEVWLCSGQSNMELRLFYSLGAAEEIAASENPLLREFTVKKVASPIPLDDVQGKWELASPQTSMNFGGVAYYFGKMLQQDLQVPVGLVRSAWGGSSIESWMSEETLDRDPDLRTGKEAVLEIVDGFPDAEERYYVDYVAWQKAFQREDHPSTERPEWQNIELDTTEWQSAEVPGLLSKQGMPADGALWLRKEVILTQEASAEGWGEVHLGRLGDFHEVYWDGELKTETSPGKDYPFQQAKFRLGQKSELSPGKHTLAIRIFSNTGRNGVVAKPDQVKVGPRNIPLSGEWLARVEFVLPQLSGEARQAMPEPPREPPLVHHVASRLYNGMIAPLVPYGIRGAIWYQGESNGGRARQYRSTFPMMIESWRDAWGQGDFSFYYCQLANYSQSPETPGDSDWAELREAQMQALNLPNSGQAVLIDTGTAEDIHPLMRREQGERLARVALAETYGQDIPYTGPVFDKMTVEGNRVRVQFSSIEGELVARPLSKDEIVRYVAKMTEPKTKPRKLPIPDSEVQGFAVCGKDGVWHWAYAKIDGDSVIVWSPEVDHPSEVRYAWANNPVCNLYDSAGLPASPFRTDDFPGVADGRYFMEDYNQ